MRSWKKRIEILARDFLLSESVWKQVIADTVEEYKDVKHRKGRKYGYNRTYDEFMYDMALKKLKREIRNKIA